MELMGKEAALSALKNMTGWDYRDNAISKTFELDGFRPAVALLNRIADAAEQQQHHPELTVSGSGDLTVVLSTHSEGGVTSEDVKLATTIETQARQS